MFIILARFTPKMQVYKSPNQEKEFSPSGIILTYMKNMAGLEYSAFCELAPERFSW